MTTLNAKITKPAFRTKRFRSGYDDWRAQGATDWRTLNVSGLSITGGTAQLPESDQVSLIAENFPLQIS